MNYVNNPQISLSPQQENINLLHVSVLEEKGSALFPKRSRAVMVVGDNGGLHDPTLIQRWWDFKECIWLKK